MAKKAAKKKVKKTAAKKAVKKTVAKKKKKASKAAAKTKVQRKKQSKASKSGAPDVPNKIGLTVQHVDYLTYKVEQVRKFYGDVLGFKTEQSESKLNYLFVHITPNSTLGFMPPHPQMTGEQPPPKEPTLYFVVEDVDKVFATLMAKGVAFMGPPQEMPWGHRVVMTTDPEGRTVMLGSEYEPKEE
jgi:predicted enzyme related to lactoylglutathione lyase